MLWDLCEIGQKEFKVRVLIISLDMIMILAGLIGGLMENNSKWFFLAFGMLMFLPILYYLVDFRGDISDLTNFGFVCSQPKRELNQRERLYNSIMFLTVGSWFIYPIIWILAEGTGVISVSGEAIAYTVLDIISKTAFGFLIATNPWLANRIIKQPYAVGNKKFNQ